MSESLRGPVIRIRQPGRQVVSLVVTDTLEIGRDCIGLIIDDERVSRRHIEVRPAGDVVDVRDLGSSNGTQIDGEDVAGPTTLAPGQALVIGDTTIEIVAVIGGDGGVIAAETAGPEIERTAPTSIELVADAVLRERISLSAEVGSTRTIVFSDIEGSTDLAVRLGDVGWYEVLGRHNDLLRQTLRRHRGEEIKSQGDGFMLTFDSARSAVLFMIDVQRGLATEEWRELELRVRVGAHTGEAMESADGDLHGRAVIMAARVGAEAEGGEILVSALVREIVEVRDDIDFGAPRSVTLKGFDGLHLVHPVLW